MRHCATGALRVLIYHGPNRATSTAELCTFDVVLTTYSVLEGEYRRMMEPSKMVCQWCRKKFFEQKLRIHQKYFCGPDAERTEKQAKAERTRGGAGRPSAAADDEDEDDEPDSDDDSPKPKKKSP